MHKSEKKLKSHSFDLTSENKENEVLAALNKTEIELSKINKYLYEDYQTLTNISTQQPKNSKVLTEKNLENSNQASKNEPNEHSSTLFCSPRFNPTHELLPNMQKTYFKIIKPETKEQDNQKVNKEEKKKKPIATTFTLNDCSKTQSSETSKDISINHAHEAPIQTFQMRGTPEKSNTSLRSSSPLDLSIKNSHHNFEEISEIQMIDNLEPDSFKLNEKSTLKGNKFDDLNHYNYENMENFPNNLNNLTLLLEIEREKNMKLEEKLKNKDCILSQMKIFHNELQMTLKETQKELDKQNSLRSLSSINCSSENQIKTIKRLTKENQELKKRIMEKDLKLEAFMKEERQKMEDVSNDKNMMKKMNNNLSNLSQMNKNLTGEIEVLRQHKNVVEKEKKFLKASLQENQMIIKELNNEKDILIKRVENMIEFNKEKGKCFQAKMNQTYDEIANEKTYKDLIYYKKMTQQFIESLSHMMVSISPEGYFDEKPTLKKIWKLLKKILEEYMNIKIELNEKNETIHKLLEIFSTNNEKEILPIMNSFINEYDFMGKIINVFKKGEGLEENDDDLQSLYEVMKKKYD